MHLFCVRKYLNLHLEISSFCQFQSIMNVHCTTICRKSDAIYRVSLNYTILLRYPKVHLRSDFYANWVRNDPSPVQSCQVSFFIRIPLLTPMSIPLAKHQRTNSIWVSSCHWRTGMAGLQRFCEKLKMRDVCGDSPGSWLGWALLYDRNTNFIDYNRLCIMFMNF